MMSFIGDDCQDLASGSIPKRRTGSWRHAHAGGAGAGLLTARTRLGKREAHPARTGL